MGRVHASIEDDEARHAARAVTQYFVTSGPTLVVAMLALAGLASEPRVLLVGVVPLGLALLGLSQCVQARFRAAQILCVVFLAVGGAAYPLLIPGASTELLIASNLPALFIWFPARLRRARVLTFALLFVELVALSAYARWPGAPRLFGPEVTEIARWVVTVVFPLDLLGTLTALLAHRDQQQAELRAARDAARTADQLKTRILNSVAHELRSPLAATLGLLGEAAETTPPGPAQRVHAAGRQVQEVLRRTTDLLDLARLESGSARLAPGGRGVSVAELAAASWRRVAPEGASALETEGPEALVDGVVGRRVLEHLLENAIQHGAAPVRLTWSRGPRGVELSVRDAGAGVPREARAQLFRPFGTASCGADDARAGKGTGLALARALARAAGGDLSLEASPAGAGASFRLTLPAASAPGRVTPAEPPLSLSVLVVEDEALNRRIVQRQLERLGCRVTLAEDGLEGVRAVDGASFDVVLMDVRMPRMDGLTATRVIKERLDAPQIVALTANALAGDRERCLEAGMDDFLAKPLDAKAFLAVLGALGVGRAASGG